MKKLIVLSVVLALVASAAFAVDLGGTVIGGVNLVNGQAGDGASSDVMGGAQMKRIRIEGGGEAGEGKFGGYFRLDHEDKGAEDNGGLAGNAWWKPIDQVKIIVGSNGGDGFYGKEGVTGWMFYQTVSDAATIVNPGNCWGGSYSGGGDDNIIFRNAFYGGDGGGNALRLEIKPIDILGINIVLPYYMGTETWGAPKDGKLEDLFNKITAQIDLNFDFGNIALTYTGKKDAGDIYLYYGGSFGDLGLDFGFHYNLEKDAAMGVGLGLKYATDSFGLKFRTVATLGGGDKFTKLLADVMPFFPLGDNLTAFVSVGLAMVVPDGGDTLIGWHFNPYLQIGEEWGSKFVIGIKVSNDAAGYRGSATAPWVDEKIIKWSIPISIMVNF